jgi:hypothetical protein
MLLIIHTIPAIMSAEANTSIPKISYKVNQYLEHIHSNVGF